MNAPSASPFHERQRTQHRALLSAAEKALREILHAHLVEPNLRAHAERAAAHVREAQLAITNPTGARTVEGLGKDLDRVGRFLARLPASSSHRP